MAGQCCDRGILRMHDPLSGHAPTIGGTFGGRSYLEYSGVVPRANIAASIKSYMVLLLFLLLLLPQ